MKIAIGSDHAGFKYKKEIIKLLRENNHKVDDCGIYEEIPIKNYEVAEKVGLRVSDGKADWEILICGTGIGMIISANKIPNIRAALCHNLFTAEMSHLHNDSNVLVLGSRVVCLELAKEIVEKWMNAEFEGERHISRNEYIMFLGNKYRRV